MRPVLAWGTGRLLADSAIQLVISMGTRGSMKKQIAISSRILGISALALMLTIAVIPTIALAQATADTTSRFEALYAAAKYGEAASYAQAVLAKQTTSSSRATWMHNLAMAYDGQGRYREAEPIYRQSLAILEQSLGKDHANVALSLSNLANTLTNLGKLNEAEQDYKRAIAIRQKAGGPENPEIVADLIGLAGIYYARGRYSEVEPLYQLLPSDPQEIGRAGK